MRTMDMLAALEAEGSLDAVAAAGVRAKLLGVPLARGQQQPAGPAAAAARS